MSNQIFEHLGYHIDYWVNSKYVGFIKTDEADRETFDRDWETTYT